MLRGLERRLAKETAEVRARVEAVQGDMRSARLGRRFPLVIAPFNVVQHLYDRRDVELFLARVRDHLRPSGRFVFDVLAPDPRDLAADPAKRYRAPRFRHPSTGGVMRYAERFEYDSVRQVLLISLEFEPEDGSPPFTVPLTHRQFFPGELEALLHYNGFSDIHIASGNGEGPNVLGDSFVVACRLGPKGRRRPAGSAKKSPRTAARRASVAKRPGRV
jgi:SAM-dependent methyltransferase